MNAVDQVRALFERAEVLECVENTYIPARAGTRLRLDKVGKTRALGMLGWVPTVPPGISETRRRCRCGRRDERHVQDRCRRPYGHLPDHRGQMIGVERRSPQVVATFGRRAGAGRMNLATRPGTAAAASSGSDEKIPAPEGELVGIASTFAAASRSMLIMREPDR